MPMSQQKKGIIAAIAMILALIACLVWFAFITRTDDAPPLAQPTGSPQTQPAPQGMIKVGVMCSLYSATGPHWTSNEYGYGISTDIAAQLQDQSIAMYWIIEPGTEDQGAVPEVVRRYPHVGILNGADAAQLRQLDVIIVKWCNNLQPDVLNAIEEAVQGGVGLLNHGLGTVTPGTSTPQVLRLAGLKQGKYGWNPKPVDCTIVNDHPILGKSAGLKGQPIRMDPNGVFGAPDGTPLIQVSNISDVGARRADGDVFYPLYTSQLSKGRIIVCSFMDLPPEIRQTTRGRFYIRCVQWLAGRPLD